MTITEPPRSAARRKQDVLARLEREMDIWVASADTDGVPCLVPLWFVWDGESVWLATRPGNPTGRNLRAVRRTRLALGDTRDVVLIDGDAEAFSAEEVPDAAAEAFHAKTGWDPRADKATYAYYRVRPRAVQAWHEERELPHRHVMSDGVWTV
ncbi:pyridoxamine 5'-phosphate oxidase family protein [Streptomyces spinoverrucosus]|uniref:pyridoxamine 5'-phosphate oxidase family protein n=1 Tax=Streptomyces spinoverrucosus TaxID=284043 RepID=UPI0018C372BF|nr:pyridoxamine 5'-phosphate oxidase family protein [Streptomyces spinoverrucosus]MBG0857496.1 pyridoxamine 5'-phosphate oxidase family protein [Streptomyces spinoverrucosus]